MRDRNGKEVDLGKSGMVRFHVSENAKRLLIEFKVDENGLTKTGVNYLIRHLVEVREQMVR